MPPRQSHRWSNWVCIPTSKRRLRLWFWARAGLVKRVGGRFSLLSPHLSVLTALQFTAMVVRFITRRFIGEYDPNLEKIYTCQTTLDKESVQFDILDATGQLHVSELHKICEDNRT